MVSSLPVCKHMALFIDTLFSSNDATRIRSATTSELTEKCTLWLCDLLSSVFENIFTKHFFFRPNFDLFRFYLIQSSLSPLFVVSRCLFFLRFISKRWVPTSSKLLISPDPAHSTAHSPSLKSLHERLLLH